MRWKFTALAAIAIVGITTVLYFWGIPVLVALIVPHIPVSWEEQLGEAVVKNLAPSERRCTDSTRTPVIEHLLVILTAPLSQSPYPFRVVVVNDPMVNALAAPGGYIVLFRGLLERTQSAEELAGVLAHELQHILQRHATQTLLRHAATGLLLAVLSGDPTGTVVYGLEGARTLAMLHYSRQNEEEADAKGLQMLRTAGVDPQGMISFFETLKRYDATMPGILQYLSTHPNAEDRIKKLKLLVENQQRNSTKLLPNYEWRDITKICQTMSP
jgi:predicted Zn-dependent protease